MQENRYIYYRYIYLCMGIFTLCYGFMTRPTNWFKKPKLSSAEVQLKQDMRKLWIEHAIWDDNAITAVFSDPTAEKIFTNRLIKNAEDIGKALSSYYESSVTNNLITLIKQHVTISFEVLKALKETNNNLKDTETHWQNDTEKIATQLNNANAYWSKSTFSSLLKQHLDGAKAAATAYLQKNWDTYVKQTDKNLETALKIADTLTEGIVKQYPKKFN